MRIKNVIYWTIVIFLGVVFLLVGVGKLMALQPWQQRFVEQWGLPAWLVPIVGIAELVGGIMILTPRFRTLGAATIAVVMVGATGTHLAAAEWTNVPITAMFAALAVTTGYCSMAPASGETED